MDRYDILSSFTKGSHNRLKEKVFINENPSLHSEICEYTSDLVLPYRQRIWHWVNHVSGYVYCIECGINRVSFNMSWSDGYKKFCSNKCSSNNRDLKNKKKNTLLERYGVDHYSKTKEYVDKVKSTSISRYGVDNFAKTDEFVQKSKKTFMDRYGVDSYTKTPEYLEKSKSTCLSRYGVDNYVKTGDYKDKFKKTCMDKYGSFHIYQSDSYRNNFSICQDSGYLGYSDGMNLFNCPLGHSYSISTDNYYGRTKNGIPLCTVCNPIGELNSIKEKELFDFIRSVYDGVIVGSYRDGMEIDVYLPDKNIGFEFNGLYWHSEIYKDRGYHLDKTLYFGDKGIRVVHIWEDDWVNKRNIIESQIKSLLGLIENKIYARQCRVVEISSVKSFLDENHILGNDRSNKKLCLFYGCELVSVMTFNKSEGRNIMGENEWNLSRFCNKRNMIVVGGASKLLSYFVSNNDVHRIISYADRDWSIGNLYGLLGFDKISEGAPDYKYVVGGVRLHKQNFTKKRLNIGKSVKESEFMSGNGLYRIWDCGKIKFEKIFSSTKKPE
jgi:hypothetical protein